ncbi:MAG: glutamate--tRNA ligase family protein [Myxococcota bacterium]
MVSRFAPTTSGPAHPGTLVAGLLAWLDARSRGARFALRLEDIDLERCTPGHAAEMREALAWLGLDWDEESRQSANRAAHEAALDRLEASGLLYPCSCSRSEIARGGERAADGGWRYSGRCRERTLSGGGWRAVEGAVRLRLPAGRVELCDESGLDLSQDPLSEGGDPVLRRRDRAIAYHLAVVVDDAESGITRVVRGRDIAPSTATHVLLQRALDLPTPSYRHHFLLLEETGGKLAKLHGAVGWRELAAVYDGPALCGLLAHFAGLSRDARPVTPRALLEDFDWARVRSEDLVVRWTGSELVAA